MTVAAILAYVVALALEVAGLLLAVPAIRSLGRLKTSVEQRGSLDGPSKQDISILADTTGLWISLGLLICGSVIGFAGNMLSALK